MSLSDWPTWTTILAFVALGAGIALFVAWVTLPWTIKNQFEATRALLTSILNENTALRQEVAAMRHEAMKERDDRIRKGVYP